MSKSKAELLASAKRELAMRRRCYPRWVADDTHKMTAEEADHETACQAETVAILQKLADEEQGQGQLF